MTDWRSRQMQRQELVLEATDKDYLLVGFHDFDKSTFIPPAPLIFEDTSATGSVEYVEKFRLVALWDPCKVKLLPFQNVCVAIFAKTAAYDHASTP